MSSIPPSSAMSAALRPASPGTPAASSYPMFRRRTLGRAASPPTWAYYEQIPVPGDDESGDDSDEDHSDDEHDHENEHDEEHDEDEDGFEMEFEHVEVDVPPPPVPVTAPVQDAMDVDDHHHHAECPTDDTAAAAARRAAKGKERAVEPPPAQTSAQQMMEERERARKTQRKAASRTRLRESVYRPILTIHRSQGFVWNQDLFVPAYIKDRYVTSTSPPGESCVSLNASASPNPYEGVEVVEIRVTGQELEDIFP